MSASPPQTPRIDIDLIDRLARAVFIWVRHETMQQRFNGLPVARADQFALAAGFLAGLRARAELTDCEARWVAYVYGLMSGERKAAMELLDVLLADHEHRTFSSAAYLQGQQTARTLFAVLPGRRQPIADGSCAGPSSDEAAYQSLVKTLASSLN